MKRILLVDDDSSFRLALSMTLEKASYEVVQAANGKDALDILQRAPKFDLAIIDILMPEMNGIDLIKAIRKKDMNFKILAITGGGSLGGTDLYLSSAQLFGADFCLDKPFRAEQVLAMIKKCIGENSN